MAVGHEGFLSRAMKKLKPAVLIVFAAAIVLVAVNSNRLQAAFVAPSDRPILVSNFRGDSQFSKVGMENVVATQFTTGTSAATFTLASMVIPALSLPTELPVGLRLSLWSASSDTDPIPDMELGAFLNPPFQPIPPGQQGSFQIARFALSSPVTLASGTSYFIVLEPPASNDLNIASTASSEDSESLPGWSIADTTIWKAKTANWESPVPVGNKFSHALQMQLETVDSLDPGVTIDTDPTTNGAQTTAVSMTEGGTATYSVVLDSVPTDNVTITPTAAAGLSVSPTSISFTVHDWDTPKSFTITADHDDDLTGITGAEITHAVTGYGEITTADAVSVNVTEDDSADFTISPPSVNVNEQSTATYSVVLDFQPSSSVTVTPSVTANRGLTFNPTSLTFTTTNWNVAQEVTITAADDTNFVNESATITHAVTQSGGTMEYASVTPASVPVNVNDNDVLTLDVSSLTVDEGGSALYNVALIKEPSGNVTVDLSLSTNIGLTVDTDTDMSGNQTTLSFTTQNWSTAQSVAVAATEDDDAVRNTGTITHTATGGGLTGGVVNLATTVTDNDEIGIILGGSATYNEMGSFYEMTIEEGAGYYPGVPPPRGEYTVKLASQPFPSTENVQVEITVPEGLVSIKTPTSGCCNRNGTLYFNGSNWDVPQTVEMLVGQDFDDVDVTYRSITHVATGANFDGAEKSTRDLEVTVEDDDTPGLLLFDGSELDVNETDGTVVITIANNLTVIPSSEVTVTLTQPTNTDVTVDTDPLTDGNQTTITIDPDAMGGDAVRFNLSVTVAHDETADDETATIAASASQSGGDMEYDGMTGELIVNIIDDEEVNITQPPSTFDLTEDPNALVNIAASFDLALDVVPTTPVTITMTAESVEPAPVTGSAWTNPDIAIFPRSVVLDATTLSKTVFIDLNPDYDAEDDVVLIRFDVSQSGEHAEYDGFTIQPIRINISDPEQATVQFRRDGETAFSNQIQNLEVDGQTFIDVTLSHQPRGDVAINVSAPDEASSKLRINSANARFTPSAWSATNPQIRRVELVEMVDDDSFSETYDLDFSVTGYGSGTIQDHQIRINDADPVTAEFDEASRNGLLLREDSTHAYHTDTYKIRLTSRPSTATGSAATVSVAITADNDKATVSPNPAVLNASNWEDGVTVTVTAAQDDDGVDDRIVLTHVATSGPSGSRGDYHGVEIATMRVLVTDDDAPAVLFENPINPTSRFLFIAENADDTPATGTLKVKLATEPRDTVTVTVEDSTNTDVTATPRTLTFNSSDWRISQTVTVTVVADNDLVEDRADISFSVVQNGTDPDEYEGLSLHDFTVIVADPDEINIDISETTLNVTEESTATYGIRLSHQPRTSNTSTVLISLTSPSGSTPITVQPTSMSFDSTNWDQYRTVTITGAADANLTNETFTLTNSILGPDAGTAQPTLTVTRVDNDTANLDISKSSVTVGENSSSFFEVELTQQPAAQVSVTVTAIGSDHDLALGSCADGLSSKVLNFSPANYSDKQRLDICAGHDYDAKNDTAKLSFTVSSTDANYNNLSVGQSSVTVTDDDTEGVTISETALNITEGDGSVATATYDVSLTAAPTGGNVNVTIAVPNNTDVTVNPTVLTFRPSDWSGSIPVATPTVTKSVEVRVAEDDGAGNDSAEITHTQGGGSYGSGTSLPSVDVNITDSDTREVLIDAPDPFTFNEGGSLAYTVKLGTEPTGQVTITIDDGAATDDITIDETALQFDIANWNQPQTAIVSASTDEDAADDTTTIEHTVSGADYGDNSVTAESINVTVSDQNVRGVILQVGGVENPTNPTFSIGEGFGQVEYFIKLATKPINTDGTDGAVTVTVTTSNTDELAVVDPGTAQTVASYEVEFDATNWNEFERVAVAAPAEDGDALQDIVTITHAVSGSDYGANSVTADSIQVTINDDDAPTFSTSSESLNIIEGNSGAYTVVLDTLPVGGDVTVTITVGSNPDIRLVDDSNNEVTELELEFTTSNWSTAQTVTVRVAEDNDAVEDTGTIRHTAAGANFTGSAPEVVMTVDVQETTEAGVTIEPMSLIVTEGRTGTYNVNLQSQPQANVTIVVTSSNVGKVSVAPGRLTFRNSDWDQPQKITVTGVRDSDANNETATISHVSSGDIYDDLEIDDVIITVIEDGTAVRDDSSFLQRSSCEGEVRLTWNSPTADGVTIDSYRIEWRSGEQQYSTARSVTALPDATSFTLTSLANGVSYTIRVLGLDSNGNMVWSRETTAMPSEQSCISEVRFGNILADSTPVIVELEDPEPGTVVNMRYRSLNPGVWSDVQSKAVEAGEMMVTFDIRGLQPDNEYEVQTWLGSSRPPSDDRAESAPMAVAQTIFRTTSLPDGVTFFSGGGGGSIARIGRIEPSIRSVKLSAGDEVVLSVEVWGRQGLSDNGLADKAPADGRPEVTWSSSGGGTFEEGRIRREWRDGVANDRQVTFVAPSNPGTVTVTASLVDSADCLAQQEDETPQEHEARCSAEIEVTVVRRATAPIIVTAPVNPPGVIPETLSDSEGVAYAVFTPVEGGFFAGDGYSLVAGAGAVSNGEYIGVSMTPIGEASNVGMTWHRYTLGGLKYVISAVDASGEAVSDYGLAEAVTACVPLPAELRGNIAEIFLTAADDGGDTTVLSTSVKITPDGVSVCGKLSTLPATVAVGKVGSPPEVADPSEEVVDEGPLPDTGRASLAQGWVLWLMLAGAVTAVLGASALRLRARARRRRRSWPA